MSYDFEQITFAECQRFYACSRKRAFVSRWYVDRYAEAQFEKDEKKLYSYRCRFCEDFHLTKTEQNN
jgi:aspartate carbamoyltransferase regulatory subunit